MEANENESGRFAAMSDGPVSAMIPVRRGEEAFAGWRMGGQTLVERAIDKVVSSIAGIRQVFVVGRDSKAAYSGTAGHSNVVPLEADLPPLSARAPGDPLRSVRELAGAAAGVIETLAGSDGGLLVLDPLRPLIRPEEIFEAAKGFRLLDVESRRRIGVVGVSRLRNHHHPKKILRLAEDGALAHFQEDGRGVFQRQQLQGDDYYVIDPAVTVLGPLVEETSWDPAEWVAVPLHDEGVRVESRELLDLAGALEQAAVA